MSIFFERYGALCKERGESPNSVAKKLGISSGSITAWKKGAMPRIETVNMISAFFHVSTDYLMGNVSDPFFYLDNERIKADINSYEDVAEQEKVPTPEGEREPEDPDIRMIARAGKKMTPEQRKNLRKYAQYMFPEAFEDDDT